MRDRGMAIHHAARSSGTASAVAHEMRSYKGRAAGIARVSRSAGSR